MTQPESQVPAVTIPEVLARIKQSWRAFQLEQAAIPDERMLEPNAVGTWSVKDVMGHVAVWDQIAIDKINRAVGKPARPRPEPSGTATQAINDHEAAARADRSLAGIRDEMSRTHDQLLTTLQTLGTLDPQVETAICAGLPEDTDAHYAGHLNDLRQWRERTGRT